MQVCLTDRFKSWCLSVCLSVCSDGRESSTVTKVFLVELLESNRKENKNFLPSDEQVINHLLTVSPNPDYISHRPWLSLFLQRMHMHHPCVSSDRQYPLPVDLEVSDNSCPPVLPHSLVSSFHFSIRLRGPRVLLWTLLVLHWSLQVCSVVSNLNTLGNRCYTAVTLKFFSESESETVKTTVMFQISFTCQHTWQVCFCPLLL